MALLTGYISIVCAMALLCAFGVPRLGDALLARRGPGALRGQGALRGSDDFDARRLPAPGGEIPPRLQQGRAAAGQGAHAIQGARPAARAGRKTCHVDRGACRVARAAPACARLATALCYGLLLSASGAGLLACALCALAFLVVHVGVYCDCLARVIPVELSLALAVCGVCLCLAQGGASLLLARAAALVLVGGLLLACNAAARLRGRDAAFGGGDTKTLPVLALFGNAEALLGGLFACSLFTACAGLGFALARRRLRGVHVPLAPGILVCLAVATLGT